MDDNWIRDREIVAVEVHVQGEHGASVVVVLDDGTQLLPTGREGGLGRLVLWGEGEEAVGIPPEDPRDLVGLRITALRPFSSEEMHRAGWYEIRGYPTPILDLSDGRTLQPESRDGGRGKFFTIEEGEPWELTPPSDEDPRIMR